jgi:L-ribulose-5-phosphate 4-epimerase
MLTALRREVLEANREIASRGLARFTFGNASGIDRAHGLVVIKPSGVAYDQLTDQMLVATNLDGQVVEGSLRPSSDLATHIALYRAFPAIGGIVHTHSRFATVWAQAGREIPCLGTTHADHFHGPIPVTDPMSDHAIAGEYEANTAAAIVARFSGLDPGSMPAALVHGHASFCWGESVGAALETASILEEVAEMAYHTIVLNAEAGPIAAALLNRHYHRKHGSAATYGQR